MRRYILTEKERQRLTDWILYDDEDDSTRKLFHIWRYSYPRLRDDTQLLILVTKKLRAKVRCETRPRIKPGKRRLPRWILEGRTLLREMKRTQIINKV